MNEPASYPTHDLANALELQIEIMDIHSRIRFENVVPETIADYVVGNFPAYMCWFVHLASASSDYVPHSTSKERTKARDIVLNELTSMKTYNTELLRRFLSEYMATIRIKFKPNVTPNRQKLIDTLNPFVIDCKNAFPRPRDRLQDVIRHIVRTLVGSFVALGETLIDHAYDVQHSRQQLYEMLLDATMETMRKRKYGTELAASDVRRSRLR